MTCLRRLGRVVLGLVVVETAAVVVFRSRWQPAVDLVRRFNRSILNPVMLRLAGSRWWYASAVHHVGRRSGRRYSTPVVAERVGDAIYIPLPYGSDVDWCNNVLASGSCVVERKGRRVEAASPEIVPASQAAPLLPVRRRLTFALYGVDSYLRLLLSSDEDLRPVSGSHA